MGSVETTEQMTREGRARRCDKELQLVGLTHTLTGGVGLLRAAILVRHSSAVFGF